MIALLINKLSVYASARAGMLIIHCIICISVTLHNVTNIMLYIVCITAGFTFIVTKLTGIFICIGRMVS